MDPAFFNRRSRRPLPTIGEFLAMLAALGVNPQAKPPFRGRLTTGDGDPLRLAWLERSIAGETFTATLPYSRESDPVLPDVARSVCRRLRIDPRRLGL